MSSGARLQVVELTAAAPGAVRVLSLRGAGALEALRRLAPTVDPATARPVLVRLSLGDETLEEALVCRRGPAEIELCLSGSEPLVRRVLVELGGARPPEPRTLEECARALCASAPSEAGARILLDQAEGALRRALEALPTLPSAAREAEIEALIERGRHARRALTATEVVLAGPVNAGKSTLFNALVGEELALVSPLPGTTRDWLRAPARLGPWPILLSDIAGERALEAPLDPPALAGDAPADEGGLERSGQALGRRARARAELIVWLEPCGGSEASAPLPPELQGDVRVRRVRSQADRVSPAERPAGALSALTDPEGARRGMAAVFRARFGLPSEAWSPGLAVPFLPEHLALLVSLRGSRAAALREGLRALLEPRG